MSAPTALLDEIKNLEPLPHTAQRLTEAAFEENLSLSEIADVVEYDQAVVANILRIANSPLYRGLVPIEDIRQAVSRLGLNALLEIVLGVVNSPHWLRFKFCPACDTVFYDKSTNRSGVWCSQQCGNRMSSRTWRNRHPEAAKEKSQRATAGRRRRTTKAFFDKMAD